MKHTTLTICTLLALCAAIAPAQLTTTLKPKTTAAFDQYVEQFEARFRARVEGNGAAPWVDEHPTEKSEVKQGQILVRQLPPLKIKVPGGMVHSWVGSVFAPGATIDGVLKILLDYDRHHDIYSGVLQSKLVSHHGDEYRSHLRVLRKKVLTAVLDIDYRNHLERLGDHRAVLTAISTRITQVQNAGEANEKELPVGKDSGFLWRQNSYWVLREADGGLWMELETLSLSRTIPVGLGWAVKPFITKVPEEELGGTLRATRAAIGG